MYSENDSYEEVFYKTLVHSRSTSGSTSAQQTAHDQTINELCCFAEQTDELELISKWIESFGKEQTILLLEAYNSTCGVPQTTPAGQPVDKTGGGTTPASTSGPAAATRVASGEANAVIPAMTRPVVKA